MSTTLNLRDILILLFDCSVAVCGQAATRETTGEATALCGLHKRSRVFISGGNREYINLKLNTD